MSQVQSPIHFNSTAEKEREKLHKTLKKLRLVLVNPNNWLIMQCFCMGFDCTSLLVSISRNKWNASFSCTTGKLTIHNRGHWVVKIIYKANLVLMNKWAKQRLALTLITNNDKTTTSFNKIYDISSSKLTFTALKAIMFHFPTNTHFKYFKNVLNNSKNGKIWNLLRKIIVNLCIFNFFRYEQIWLPTISRGDDSWHAAGSWPHACRSAQLVNWAEKRLNFKVDSILVAVNWVALLKMLTIMHVCT